ncbi:hypothetical protein [Streptacidiphilus sp. EB129]|uniref:hypothetical protein n=1 Tax=Streptacidiphilus sp. EB129 TaxID=3156262 RepID=UPI00351472B3
MGSGATPAFADNNVCTPGSETLGDAGNYYAGSTYVGQVVLEWSPYCHAERARFQFSYYYHGNRSGTVDLFVGPYYASYESRHFAVTGTPDSAGNLYTAWVTYESANTGADMSGGFQHACDSGETWAYSSRHNFNTGGTINGSTYAWGNNC